MSNASLAARDLQMPVQVLYLGSWTTLDTKDSHIYVLFSVHSFNLKMSCHKFGLKQIHNDMLLDTIFWPLEAGQHLVDVKLSFRRNSLAIWAEYLVSLDPTL